MKNKLLNRNLSLFAIIIFSFFLRIYNPHLNPPSLNWDEVSHGYNAYSILKTGKDEWGVTFPKIFRAYGDYKLPVYIYLTVVSEAVFGLNELAVRLPSALAGTLSVLFTFLLVRKLFSFKERSALGGKNETLGILAALLMAIEPWGLFLSRVAVEANLASFLIIAGIYFFLLGLEKKGFLPLAAFLLGLSLYTYNSARIFVPLFLAILLWVHCPQLVGWFKKKPMTVLMGCLVFLAFFISMASELTSPEGQARYRWVSLLDEGAINRINEVRGKSDLPEPLPRLVHNKLTYSVLAFGKNYLSYFSPNFLFFEGGSHYQFNLSGRGLIYPLQIPFILLGFWSLVQKKDKTAKLLLAWFFLSPLAGSLTRDSPHTLRVIVMLPIPQILTSLGFWQFYTVIKIHKLRYCAVIEKTLVSFYFLILFIFLGRFWFLYTADYRVRYSWAWQYGYKETVAFAKENYQKYDSIIVSKKYGEPHEFFLFYWPWNPQNFVKDPNLVRYFKSDWYWVDAFDKFQFVNDWEIEEKLKVSARGGSAVGGKSEKLKVLLITSPGNYPEGWRKLKTINFLDNKPAFDILEF